MAAAAATYDPFFLLLSLPFATLRVPRFRLRVSLPPPPSKTAVFCLLLLSYFLVISGFLYDIITAPPGMGGRQDPQTGAYVPEVFLSGRMNAQYIIEGLSSGFMIVLGGIGLIIMHLACSKGRPRIARGIMLLVGAGMTALSYSMSLLFLKIKVGPHYLRR